MHACKYARWQRTQHCSRCYEKYACGNAGLWECMRVNMHVGKMCPDVPFVMALTLWRTYVKNIIGCTCVLIPVY
jgi:hypothetical protein